MSVSETTARSRLQAASPLKANLRPRATVTSTPVIVISRLDPRFLEGRLRKALINLCKLATEAIEFTGMAKDDAPLILGERLSLQPSPAALRKQRAFVGRDQVGMQNRMDPVLETGHLGNELCSFGHHATARSVSSSGI